MLRMSPTLRRAQPYRGAVSPQLFTLHSYTLNVLLLFDQMRPVHESAFFIRLIFETHLSASFFLVLLSF